MAKTRSAPRLGIIKPKDFREKSGDKLSFVIGSQGFVDALKKALAKDPWSA